MKILLRSTFLSGNNDNEELFKQNFLALRASGLGFDIAEDAHIWEYICHFVETHSHVPKFSTIYENFERSRETEILNRLSVLQTANPLTRGDFVKRLEDRAEDRRSRDIKELLKDTATVLEQGMEVKRGRETINLRGSFDAIHHFLENSHGIAVPATGQQLSGIANKDSEGFWEEFERVKREGGAKGFPCGIDQIDDQMVGAKKHELWIHAAFASHMKSTFALNWAYNLAVYHWHSSLYYSLEMPYKQIRNFLYALHTFHEKFRDLRVKYGIQKPPKKEVKKRIKKEGDNSKDVAIDTNDNGLSYTKIRDANLTDDERKFLEVVVDDFENCPEYGDIHVEVPNPDKDDTTMIDIKARAEVINSTTPFSMMFIDHLLLVSSRRWVASTTERLNEVVRDSKKLAMNFNRGSGMAVVALFQISREGFRAAEKAGGKYNMTHLSYANECSVRGTPVFTDRGIIPIETVGTGDRVWSRSGWKSVLNFFDQGCRSVWRVTNSSGEVLEATGNHRIRVLRDENVVWSRIDELTEGEWIVNVMGDYPWPSQNPDLPVLEIDKYEKANGQQGTPLQTPAQLNEDISYLLGAWDGDGSIHPKGIRFTGNRLGLKVRERIEVTFKRCFGHEISHREAPSRPGSFDSKWSQPLKRWFEEVSGLRGIEVPRFVKQASKISVLAYLQGLFDTDGWVNNQGVVEIKMKSEDFLREVQTLLTALGIDTTLEPNQTTLKKTGKTYQSWTLRVRGAESKRLFQQQVGFTEQHKAKMLEDTFAVMPKDKRVYPVGKVFSLVASDHAPYSMITSGRIQSSFNNSVRKARDTGLVSHGAVMTLLKVLDEDGVEDSRADILREVVSRRVTRVVQVEADVREEQVFDLEVDGDHEFQTGPFLSHNCERSADVISASWLDDNLRKAQVLFMQCLKSRDQAPFEDFYASFVPDPRRLITNLNAPEEITKQTTPEERKKAGLDMLKQENVDDLIEGMPG